MGRSRISIPREHVDGVLDLVAPVRKKLAERLGITQAAIQLWRARGAPVTAAYALTQLIERAIPKPGKSPDADEAMRARLAAIADNARDAGYDDERLVEIAEEIADLVAAGKTLPISRGQRVPGEQVRNAVVALGLTVESFANLIGSTRRSVTRWLADDPQVDAVSGFVIHMLLAERAIPLGDGVDPVTRAVADVAFDALTVGWSPPDVAEGLKAVQPEPALHP